MHSNRKTYCPIAPEMARKRRPGNLAGKGRKRHGKPEVSPQAIVFNNKLSNRKSTGSLRKSPRKSLISLAPEKPRNYYYVGWRRRRSARACGRCAAYPVTGRRVGTQRQIVLARFRSAIPHRLFAEFSR